MIHTIQFNKLSAILLDFVDHSDGFLYLRLAGAEATVNAIWAKLSARDSRGQKWGSEVNIPIPGQSYPNYVAAQKHVNYRTLRARLPDSGLVDLALIHPLLTVGEDSQRGFYILSYDQDIPPGFFERLNKSLSIPLKPEWAAWLWEQGQQPQSWLGLATRTVWENGKQVEKTEVIEATQTPITRLKSLGAVDCYAVRCDGQYRQAWLQIIRHHLNLGIRLTPSPGRRGQPHYTNGDWSVSSIGQEWQLQRGEEVVLQAPSLNYLLAEARDRLGLNLLIDEVV